MSIVGFSEKALQEYGPSGDRTLEYICAEIIPNTAPELRVYRKNVLFENVDSPYGAIVSAFHSFLADPRIGICDISRGRHGYRMTFILPETIPFSELRLILNRFFSAVSSPGYEKRLLSSVDGFTSVSGAELSPLMQLGVEVGDSLSLVSLKYYLRLPAEISSLNSPYDLISRQAYAAVESYERRGSFAYENEVLNENKYRPAFIGINDYDGVREAKLYYKSTGTGYRPLELQRSAAQLSRAFGWDSLLTEEALDSLYKNSRIYVDGVAVSLTTEGRWRLYFSRLPVQKPASSRKR